MAELARCPRAMRKAQEEVRERVGKKGKVEEGDVEELQYLKMVVRESMRLHPAVPILIPRETVAHFNLNGYDVFPGTRVHVHVGAIGRDPEVWESPEEFWPERFVGSSVDFRGQHHELLPFGAGRRGCPGISMGIAAVELALANLLCCFDWRLPEGMKEEDVDMEEEVVGLSVHKKIHLRLVPVKHIRSG